MVSCCLHGFVDSDWAGDASARKSTFGFVSAWAHV
jgi:hypothetical protein